MKTVKTANTVKKQPSSRTTPAPQRRGPVVAGVVAALAVSAVALVWMGRDDEAPAASTGAAAGVASTAMPSALPAPAAAPAAAVAIPQTPGQAVAARAPVTVDPAVAAAVRQQFEQLRGLPAGEAAIELGRQIEAGMTAANAPAYAEMLLQTDNAAVERAAITALARGDAASMAQLAARYGETPAERRGRILQVLEGASNPQALSGLVEIAAADTGDKRSPVTMSAMVGMAHLGNGDSVSHLLGLLSTPSADFALAALERAQSPQALEMIAAAAAGSKDLAPGADFMRPSLRRIVEAAQPR